MPHHMIFLFKTLVLIYALIITLEAAMLEEKVILCHNDMPYLGVALLVITNHDEKFIWHFKKTFMP